MSVLQAIFEDSDEDSEEEQEAGDANVVATDGVVEASEGEKALDQPLRMEMDQPVVQGEAVRPEAPNAQAPAAPPNEEPKIVFKKPSAKRMSKKNRPTAKDFMKTGI